MIVQCERLTQGGVALAHAADGKVLLVEGALAGETVECVIDKRMTAYLMCHVVAVVTPSPDRITPPCPYYGVCGGCNLQFLRDDKQAQVKEMLVKENLRRMAQITDIPTETVQQAATWGYRLRTRFHVDLKNKQVGFLGRKSNTLVPVDDCPILEQPLRDLLKDKKTLLEQGRQSMFENRGKDGLFEVSAIVGEEGISFGDEIVHVNAGDHRFAVSASVFFQGNRLVLPSMGRFVADHVIGERVMDLYSGVGTFSVFLPKEKYITLVEREKKCLKLAKINVPQGHPFAQDVGEWKGKDKVDTVIIDPPRGGLDRGVPHLIASWKPRRIIAMSCNSVTLARDSALLRQEGYEPKVLKVFDLYPQTFEQEACVVFDRKESANA